ncbi:hypothetical protein MKW94_020267 [Papaver nudicaule]|uniref:proline--tRNA ligase n=1 Tax=Papaver nudicaule TaxID=74823 RepID=A0AA41VCK8_PAPNU|nr:hypothetical protein [Papaver nudicaule]
MVMVHGDDKGLVFPLKAAPVQVILTPVPYKDDYTQAINQACPETAKDLRFPIEIGPKNMAKNQVRIVRRDKGAKQNILRTNLVEQIKDSLDIVRQSQLDAARRHDACVTVAKTWEEFTKALKKKKMPLTPWCNEEVKARISKGEMGACKNLCTPFYQPELLESTLYFASENLPESGLSVAEASS